MANSKRTSKNRRRPPLKYFYWEGLLYRILRTNKPANLVDAWCYRDHKRVSLLHSDYRMNAKPALTTSQAAKLLNISKRNIQEVLKAQHIRPPQKGYPLENPNARVGYYYWSEENIMELYDYLMTVHIGRPRNDGVSTPNQRLPTKAAISAKLDQKQTLYIQDDDGTFVPLYEPPKF